MTNQGAREREERTMDDGLKITACDACKQASCWQGIFFCDKYQSAGTMELTVAELRQLDLEHPSYWAKDPNAIERDARR